MSGCGLDRSSSESGPVGCCCERGDELSGYAKDAESLDEVSNCQLLRNAVYIV